MGNLKSRLQDPEYANWVKAGLCLISFKSGLESYSESKSKEFHQAVLDHLVQNNIAVAGNCMCPNCDIKFKGNKSYAGCHHIFCNSFLDAIFHVGVDPSLPFTFKMSNLANTNPQLWHNTPWELAKLFMNPGQKATQTGPAETDISGIINFLDHCKVAKMDILNTLNITEVRTARNTIMHSAEMKLSNNEFQMLVQSMVDLLEDPKVLVGLQGAQDASKQIKQIVSSNFVVSLEDENKVLNDLGSAIRTMSENLQTEIQVLKKQQKDGLQDQAEDIMGLSKYFEEQIFKMKTSLTLLEKKIAKDKTLRNAMKSKLKELQRSTEQTQHEYQNVRREISILKQQMTGYEHRTHLLEMAHTSLESRFSAITNRAVTESDCLELRNFLLNTYESVCDEVPLSPIYEGPNDDVLKVPVHELYTDVQILQHDRHGKGKKKELTSYKEVFYNQGKRNKNIFIKGEAGAGKSTWCLNLINTWCKTQRITDGQSKEPSKQSKKISDKFLEVALSPFRYVFFAQLRYVNGKSTIKECIFSPILERLTSHKDVVEHILQKFSESVLILLDGFDEYHGSISYEGLNESTVIITTRPWKFDTFLSETSNPKVDVELTLNGLNRTGVEDMIDMALKKFNDKDVGAVDRENERITCLHDIQSAGLSESVKIPLILLIVILTWLKNNSSLSLSLTRNILSMLEIILSRGEEKMSARSLGRLKARNSNSVIDKTLAFWISTYPTLSQYQTLMLHLAQLAFTGLTDANKAAALVFTQQQVMNFLDPEDLDVCFKFGLLSTATVFHSMLEKKRMCVSFYHKLIQEFFAALWIVTNKEALGAVKTQFSSKEDVFEYDNVMLFVSGLNPIVGSLLSRYLVDVSSQECRQTISDSELFTELTLNCMKEMFYSDDSEQPLYISSIVLDCYGVTVVESLLKLIGYNEYYLQTLRIYIHDVIPTEYIALLTKSLQNTKSLKLLHIRCGVTTGKLRILSLPSLSQSLVKEDKIMDDDVTIKEYLSLEEIYLQNLHCNYISVQDLPNLISLDLVGTEATESLSLEALPNLKVLKMQHIICKHFQMKSVPNLTEIILWHVKIRKALNDLTLFGASAASCCLAESNSLEKLSASYLKLRNVKLARMPKLTQLELTNIQTDFIRVSNCPLLKVLTLSDVTVYWCCIDECNSLEKLSAGNLNLNDLELASMPKLTQFDLKNLRDADSISVENCPGLTRSEEISIQNVVCKHLRVQSTSILEKMGLLQKYDTGSVKTIKFKCLKHLELFTIKGEDIRFKPLTNLTELHIENTSDINLTGILKSCPKLKGLTLRDISFESFYLRNMSNLENISAWNLNVTAFELVLLFNLKQLQLKNIQAAESVRIEVCPQLVELLDGTIETIDCKELKINSIEYLKRLRLFQINATEQLDIRNCSRLELLTLSDVRAKQITFRSLESLTELRLENVIHSDLIGLVNNCLALKVLNLMDLTIDSFSLKGMVSLEKLTALHLNLRELKVELMPNLTYLQLNDIKAAESIQVETCPKLMYSGRKPIQNVNCKHLKVRECHSLKHIAIFQINVTDTIDLSSCSGVDVLRLSDIQTEDITVKLFENLTGLLLEHASLKNFRVVLENCPKLKVLSLFDVTSETICIEESKSLEIMTTENLKLINFKLRQLPNLTELELKDVVAVESIDIGGCQKLIGSDSISIENVKCKHLIIHSVPDRPNQTVGGDFADYTAEMRRLLSYH